MGAFVSRRALKSSIQFQFPLSLFFVSVSPVLKQEFQSSKSKFTFFFSVFYRKGAKVIAQIHWFLMLMHLHMLVLLHFSQSKLVLQKAMTRTSGRKSDSDAHSPSEVAEVLMTKARPRVYKSDFTLACSPKACLHNPLGFLKLHYSIQLILKYKLLELVLNLVQILTTLLHMHMHF